MGTPTQYQDQSLIDAAKTARLSAYAPYSQLLVGAAVRDENDTVHRGCNVENASYPEGTCAETGAIAAMIAAGSTQIKAICVITDTKHMVLPCGGCLQRIGEFAAPDTPVIIIGQGGQQRDYQLKDLAPHRVGAEILEPRS